MRILHLTEFGLFLIYILCFLTFSNLASSQVSPFYPNGKYDKAVISPEEFLTFPVGSKPARYDEAIRYLQNVAAQSPRVKMVEMGETYERRKQYYLVITSEENLKNIDQIQRNNVKLADPRNTNADEVKAIIETNPAIIWIGYGIHGDELSSVDAALQIVYQLAAGTDEATMKLLHELVICLDPMENPDGRERWLAQMQQWGGAVMNSDAQSMSHTGVWPYGRGNHYLFDLNRDWFMMVNIENKNRIRSIFNWYPQVVIDSHEMGSYDTYLFSPPREPLNPNVPDHIKKWWTTFANDQAKEFDHYGWSYYTREWNDEWYPGYGSSYGLYIDAVGILYEQAGTDGSSVKRPDGTTLTYREAVHHHFVSSWSNFSTTANNRKEILRDYYASRSSGVSLRRGDASTYYLVPGENPTRVEQLVDKLLIQQIEVEVASDEFRVSDVQEYWGSKPTQKSFPQGTYIVSLDQPNGRLAKAILEFDPRMTTEVLNEERKSLEKDKDSKMYDVSAWSMPIAYHVEAYSSVRKPEVSSKRITEIPERRGTLEYSNPAFGFLFEYADDRAVEALTRLLEKGYRARIARYSFEVEGKKYPASTVLFRMNENEKVLSEEMQRVAQETGVKIFGVNTAKSAAGPDLGGNDFIPLRQPRVAILAGPEISSNGFGTIWKLLDDDLKLRVSVIHTSMLDGADVKKYNVLIMPSGGGGLTRTLGKGGLETLRRWIEDGGTLIGVGNAASFLADSANNMSNVRIRQQGLKDIDLFTKAIEQEQKAQLPLVDSVSIWEGKQPPKDSSAVIAAVPNEKELARQDERGRLFMPRGAIMRVNLDSEHWLSYGVGDKVPALYFGSLALLSKDPVETPARFSGYADIRVSGLLWPEARNRWATSAYATRESKGKGQIILFAGEPNFRGCFHSTERMLLNAVLLGPGFGADHPVEW